MVEGHCQIGRVQRRTMGLVEPTVQEINWERSVNKILETEMDR